MKGCDIMENIKKVLQDLNGIVLKENNGKINQVQARQLKTVIQVGLMKDFQDLGFEVGSIQKGFIVRIPNDDQGSLVIQLDAVIKSLDFDFDTEIEKEKARKQEIADRKKNKKTAKK